MIYFSAYEKINNNNYISEEKKYQAARHSNKNRKGKIYYAN